MRRVEVMRQDGSRLCEAEVAENPITRMVGLLGRKSLAEGHGLLIDPCGSVHSFFMRFPIDVLYLDRADVVVKAVTVPPFRMSSGRSGAKRVIELPLGTIERRKVVTGEQLEISPIP